MAKKKDLTGLVFGELTVVKEGEKKFIGKIKKKWRTTWVCSCSCGKEVTVLASNLRNGTKSCGCKFRKSKKYNFKDLTGQTFGYLTVLKRSEKFSKTRGCLWECLCECGAIVEVSSNGLTSKNNITCNVKSNHTNNNIDPRWKRYEEIPLVHLTSIKQNAIKRNLIYNVTPKYLWELFLKQNRKCVLSGVELYFTKYRNAAATRSVYTTASLDRINHLIGYEEGNVRWVHKNLNKMRLMFSDDVFLEYCRQCFLNQYIVGKIQRPSFDEYFMNIAFDVSLRSDDPDIRHGAIIVNNQNHIIGSGYNATIRGSDETKIPYGVRDKKRLWMIHAEENAILNCMSNPLVIGGAKIYITGLPCVNCLQRLINFGITEVIYADRIGSVTENEDTQKMRSDILLMSKINFRKLNLDTLWLRKNFYNP